MASVYTPTMALSDKTHAAMTRKQRFGMVANSSEEFRALYDGFVDEAIKDGLPRVVKLADGLFVHFVHRGGRVRASLKENKRLIVYLSLCYSALNEFDLEYLYLRQMPDDTDTDESDTDDTDASDADDTAF